MLTIASMEPLMAEALPIPKLSLSGRVPPNNSVLALDPTTAYPDLSLWPEFHNGVASALRVSSSGHKSLHDSTQSSNPSFHFLGNKVTRNWILYNRTATQLSAGNEASHAGT
jgi:anaphase-promoting complex subunit 1